jgi:hypothetical protein
MGYDDKELVIFEAGLSPQEMDVEFKKLYDSLLGYKNNIFHVVDTICSDCEAGERLAMNIAERDSALLQRLVAKECESRNMIRKASKESVMDQQRKEGSLEVSVHKILKTRESSIEEDSKND